MNENARLRGEPVETERLETEMIGQPKAYRFSDKELLSNHQIEIRFLSGRGCIIKVGCKEIAFESVEEAIGALNNYVRDPHSSIEYWNEEFAN